MYFLALKGPILDFKEEKKNLISIYMILENEANYYQYLDNPLFIKMGNTYQLPWLGRNSKKEI